VPGPTIHTVMVTSTTNFCPNTFSSFNTPWYPWKFMPRMCTLSTGAGACEWGASSQGRAPIARHVIDTHLGSWNPRSFSYLALTP